MVRTDAPSVNVLSRPTPRRGSKRVAVSAEQFTSVLEKDTNLDVNLAEVQTKYAGAWQAHEVPSDGDFTQSK